MKKGNQYALKTAYGALRRGNQAGKTETAGETNGHCFSNLLALSTDHLKKKSMPPNGLRYPRVGGTRERYFDGAHFRPRKLLKNAATPTRRVHAVLGAFWFGRRKFSSRTLMLLESNQTF
jgi:hypothetical protein